MVSGYRDLKMSVGGAGHTPFIKVRNRRKKHGGKGDIPVFDHNYLLCVLILTWGFPPKAFQHSNMKQIMEMGVGKRTRVIINTKESQSQQGVHSV